MDLLGPDPLRSSRCPALMAPAARGEPHLSQNCDYFADVADRRWQPALARRGWWPGRRTSSSATPAPTKRGRSGFLARGGRGLWS